MSICRPPRLRGDDPSETMAAALKAHLLAGELPPPRTCRASKKFANSAAFNPSTITRAIAGMHTSRVVTAITP